jgi:MFS family permease
LIVALSTRSVGRILGVTRTVFALGVVSLLMDISSETMVSVMPAFITVVLGAPATVLGLIEGLAETTASLLKAFAGQRSDRGARKPWTLWGYGLSAFSKPIIALSGSWLTLLGARLLDRTGKGLRSAPRDAIIAADTPEADLGRAFGLHRGMDTLGAAIGPLIAFFCLPLLGYRGLFWVAAIPAFLAVMVLAVFVHEKREEIASRQLEPRPTSFPKDPRILWFLIAVGVFSLGNSSDAFLLLRVKDLGVAALTVPLVYFAFNLVYALSSPIAGIVADKLGRGRVAGWGLLVFGLIYAGFGLANSSWQGWVLFGAYGVFMAFTEGVWKAYLGELAPSQARGAVYGAFNAVIGLAALPASLLAGWFWDAFSHRAPFYFGALMALLASLVLSFLTRKVSTREA